MLVKTIQTGNEKIKIIKVIAIQKHNVSKLKQILLLSFFYLATGSF
jgi:hypothetical protein